MRDYGKQGPWRARVSKEQANYRGGTPQKHCGKCSMFRAPDSCTYVKGDIKPTDVCKFYDPK